MTSFVAWVIIIVIVGFIALPFLAGLVALVLWPFAAIIRLIVWMSEKNSN